MLGELDQLFGFRERECKRLIDHDVMTGAQALLGDRMMRGIGCGHDDEIERPGQQLVDAANEFSIRIAGIRLAVPLHDRGQAQSRHGPNDRCVKDSPSKSEADEADSERHDPG